MTLYRNYKFDNIRCILTFLVVFGHFIETFDPLHKSYIYFVIYTFHIPALIFLSGYFAHFNSQKILRHWILPYLFFQVIYLTFDYYILNNTFNQQFHIGFTTPYWLLWYLITITIYYILIPMFQTTSPKIAACLFFSSILISLLSGFDNSIGTFMSISRTLVFMPFFLMGYYAANLPYLKTIKINFFYTKKFIFSLVFGIIILELFFYTQHLPAKALYGTHDYSLLHYSWIIRLLIDMCSFLWILLILRIMPNRQIRGITSIGQHTLAIYLLHGFIQRLCQKFVLFKYTYNQNMLLAFIMTCIVILLLQSFPARTLFKKIF